MRYARRGIPPLRGEKGVDMADSRTEDIEIAGIGACKRECFAYGGEVASLQLGFEITKIENSSMECVGEVLKTGVSTLFLDCRAWGCLDGA